MMIVVAITACACSVIAPQTPLRVATSGDYSPFTIVKDNAYDGFDVAVARRLGVDLDMPVEFVTVAWPDLTAATRHGDFDIAMGGVTMRPERAVVGRYTRPYVLAGTVVLIRDAYAQRFSSLDALNAPGVRIAVNAGGHLERVARETFPRATIDPVPSNDAVPQRLTSGRADAALTDTAEARAWLRPGLRALPPFKFHHKAYLLPAGDESLAVRVDDWMVAREADGWLASERARWLSLPGNPNPAGATREAVAAFIALRLSLMPRVAAAKRTAGLPIDDPAQETRVLERVRGAASQPAFVEAVYRQLIDMAKAVQNATNAEPADSLDELRDAIARIDAQLVRELDRTTKSPKATWMTVLSRSISGPGIDDTAAERLAEVLETR